MATDLETCLCSWSGGKDSCYALIIAMQQGFQPKVLLNVLNEEGNISRSHGIPSSILQAQAKAANLPVHLIHSSWKDYESNFTNELFHLKNNYKITAGVFGDIDLQAHRDWEEMVCANAGLQAVLPLWQQNRKQLVLQMLDAGIECIIVSCNITMGSNFLGKVLDAETIAALEELHIDVCGENGEFHTLVTNCSLFKNKINVVVTDKILHENYWFSKLELI